MITILCQCFLATYVAAFEAVKDVELTNAMTLTSFICDIIFFLDILINFNTCYYHQGELIQNHKLIIFNYLFRGAFLLDFATMITIFTYFFIHGDLILFSLLRMYHIPQYAFRIEEFFQLGRQMSSLFKVMKLIVFVLIIAHFFACIFYAITKEDPVHSWVGVNNLLNAPLGDLYVNSLYFSVTTMSTIGYGDIVPGTKNEKITGIAIMIVSSIVFGYILSSIGSLIIEISNYSTDAKEKMRLISKYMSEKGLNKETQNRIKKYLEYYLGKENSMKTEGNEILHFLSESLKEEIIREVNAKLLDDNLMFSTNFRKKFLYILAKNLEEKSYGPDEFVFKYEDNNDYSVYFLTSGKIDLCYERCNVVVRSIKKGACFGADEFFSGKPRSISSRIVEFSTVFYLKRETLIEKLGDFPLDKESFQQIYDSINLYSSYQYLDSKCYHCGKIDHVILNCPSCHVRINKQKVIGNYLQEQAEFRKHFKRSQRRKFNARKEIEIVQETATRIQLDFETELRLFEEEFFEESVEFSDTDEILECNIYDTTPIVYFDESGIPRTFDPETNKYWKKYQYKKPVNVKGERKQPDEIDLFIQKNYDPYYRSVSIDQIRNFEIYYPNGNMAKLSNDLNKKRFEKLLYLRVGDSAKRILPLLVKGFRLFDHRKNEERNKIHKKSTKIIKDTPPSLHNLNLVPREKSLTSSQSHTRKNSINSVTYLLDNMDAGERRKSQFANSGFRTRTNSLLEVPGNMSHRGSPKSPGIRETALKSRFAALKQQENDSSSSDDSNDSDKFSSSKGSFGDDQEKSPLARIHGNEKKSRRSSIESDFIGKFNQPARTESLKSGKLDEGARNTLKFDYADNMLKFTQKLAENKSSLLTDNSEILHAQPATRAPSSNNILAKSKVFEAPDIVRQILKRSMMKRKTKKRAISWDEHERVAHQVKELNLQEVLKGASFANLR